MSGLLGLSEEFFLKNFLSVHNIIVDNPTSYYFTIKQKLSTMQRPSRKLLLHYSPQWQSVYCINLRIFFQFTMFIVDNPTSYYFTIKQKLSTMQRPSRKLLLHYSPQWQSVYCINLRIFFQFTMFIVDNPTSYYFTIKQKLSTMQRPSRKLLLHYSPQWQSVYCINQASTYHLIIYTTANMHYGLP